MKGQQCSCKRRSENIWGCMPHGTPELPFSLVFQGTADSMMYVEAMLVQDYERSLHWQNCAEHMAPSQQQPRGHVHSGSLCSQVRLHVSLSDILTLCQDCFMSSVTGKRGSLHMYCLKAERKHLQQSVYRYQFNQHRTVVQFSAAAASTAQATSEGWGSSAIGGDVTHLTVFQHFDLLRKTGLDDCDLRSPIACHVNLPAKFSELYAWVQSLDGHPWTDCVVWRYTLP